MHAVVCVLACIRVHTPMFACKLEMQEAADEVVLPLLSLAAIDHELCDETLVYVIALAHGCNPQGDRTSLQVDTSSRPPSASC